MPKETNLKKLIDKVSFSHQSIYLEKSKLLDIAGELLPDLIIICNDKQLSDSVGKWCKEYHQVILREIELFGSIHEMRQLVREIDTNKKAT